MLDISRHLINMETQEHHAREQINNITEEINNNINVIDKPKKQYQFTEKRKLAYEKMKEAKKEARKKKVEDIIFSSGIFNT